MTIANRIRIPDIDRSNVCYTRLNDYYFRNSSDGRVRELEITRRRGKRDKRIYLKPSLN